ncbi:probable DNA-directed RNA polymerase 2, chloroplastic/mitochondrial [Coccomyxa sp. Obi]|nr:probable DNA-directed RNA polymerase 2, chloroplastic/mitochondrial [Coccomyxa sp. Obi]
MLRQSLGRHSWSRLLPLLTSGPAILESPVACRARGVLLSNRWLSAAPVPQEEAHLDAEDTAAAQKAVHERLVFELFGIRERFRESVSASTSPEGRVHRPIRRGDEPILYVTPLRELIKVMQGTSKEGGADMLRAWERQIDNETQALEEAVERYKKGVEDMKKRGEYAELTPARRMILQWFEPLRDAIAREQRAIILKDTEMEYGRMKYGPFLILLSPEQLAVMTLHIAIMAMMRGEKQKQHISAKKLRSFGGQCVLSTLSVSLGTAIRMQVGLENVRLRLERENSAREHVSERLKRIVGEKTFQKLAKGGPALGVLSDEYLKAEFNRGLAQIRDSPDLPNDVLDWFEGVEGLSIVDRLENLRQRLKVNRQKVDCDKIRAGKLRLSRAEKMFWTTPEWTDLDFMHIGTALINLLIKSTTITVPNPNWDPANPDSAPRQIEEKAFWHQVVGVHQGRTLRKVGKVFCHHDVIRQLTNVREVHDLLAPRFQPMLIPPLPWRSLDSGGHLIIRQNITRAHHYQDGHLQRKALHIAQERPPDGLSRVFDALTTIDEVGWRVNKPVFEVVEKAWAAGMRIVGFPSKTDIAPLEASTSLRFRTDNNGRQLLVTMTDKETWAEERDRFYANRRRKKKNCEMYSMRSDLSLKLMVADKFKDEPRFYYPHTLDFRGRAYPLHAHLNHMGSDVCRGILTFADAKPLGPDGLGWLYVLIANSWGQKVDKQSFEGRRHFVQRNLESVLDSAERPLDGHRWWIKAEKPWQCLAACMEVRDALASGNPAAFPSRLPVQMDGSCNGLQHYAALGRDAEGGNAVNLRPNSAPQDVYGEIAATVRETVAVDAAQGVPEAIALLDQIDRKLVKQTVMTSVYGVTFIGARLQIQNRLVERGWANNDALYRCSTYAAKMVLKGLDQNFDKATGIMQWLGQCAQVITSNGQAVAWHTPLGLPVIQPYREKSQHIVVTVLQRVVVHMKNADLPVLKRRQRTAFSPNYIHSLDSTHMMLTALACKQDGITFAGVHDSFWTHAGDAPALAQKLRRTFVDLHSQPLLGQLLAEFKTRFPDMAHQFPPLPATGDLDLNEVLDSEYFFS